MLSRNHHRLDARVSALEAYVEMPKEPTGMTVTSRLDAQHTLLLALRTEMRERFAQVDGRLTSVEGRLTRVEGRLIEIEAAIGKVLWGLVDIKKRLPKEPGDPP